MTNLIVDGFAHYSVLNANASSSAMTAGAYADGGGAITQLPWLPGDTKLYLNAAFAGTIFGNPGLRRILPAAKTSLIVSFYLAVNALPATNGVAHAFTFKDGSNAIQAGLGINSTGSLWFGPLSGAVASSSGPVMTAQTATHIEMKFTPGSGSNGAVEVRANGTAVITATGLTIPNTAGGIAQFALGMAGNVNSTTYYITDLIVRDTLGDYNNDFVGDRRVATLLVNEDDLDNQGWAARSIRRFGNGVLNNGTAASPNANPNTASGVLCGITTETNLGNLDYTVETEVRFQRLPTGAVKAVVFGKWDETGNNRSWQLYLGGPSLNNGDLIFRTSTDGTAGTATNKISYPWVPIVGKWYHIALVRDSGVTTIYVDGIPLGTGVSDASTYYAGSSRTVFGGETTGSFVASATALCGWFDECRITKGTARYTASFTPPTEEHPRGPIDDAAWSDVVWLSGWDQASIEDESGFARALGSSGGAVAITPPDGGFAFQTINKDGFNDDNFIEAALLPASAILTQTSQPANDSEVVIGDETYVWKTAMTGGDGDPFEVEIGATLLDSLANLVNAVIGGAGEGTTYGTGTTANEDVDAQSLPVNQIIVIALVAGTAGNSIPVSTDDGNGDWGSGVTELSGGVDIPDPSMFKTQHLPAGASSVDSVTIVRRSWKTDAGTCNVRVSFVGPDDGTLNGASIAESVNPSLYHDTFEVDPDNTDNPLTPTAIVQGRIKVNRLA